ncbi:MAG: hypothetical protein ACK5LL_06520, partial [Suipraeoptans sp.]
MNLWKTLLVSGLSNKGFNIESTWRPSRDLCKPSAGVKWSYELEVFECPERIPREKRVESGAK